MVPVRGGVAFLQHCPSIKDVCARATPPTWGWGAGAAANSATVKAGQTRLCPPWPRCRRKRGPAEVLMGLLPALPKPAPRVLIPSPRNACFRSRPGTPPPHPWPPSPSLAAAQSYFDKHPSQPFEFMAFSCAFPSCGGKPRRWPPE